jgi:hypothetical protein
MGTMGRTETEGRVGGASDAVEGGEAGRTGVGVADPGRLRGNAD